MAEPSAFGHKQTSPNDCSGAKVLRLCDKRSAEKHGRTGGCPPFRPPALAPAPHCGQPAGMAGQIASARTDQRHMVSLDEMVRGDEQRRGHRDAERLCRPYVEDELELGRSVERRHSRLRTLAMATTMAAARLNLADLSAQHFECRRKGLRAGRRAVADIRRRRGDAPSSIRVSRASRSNVSALVADGINQDRGPPVLTPRSRSEFSCKTCTR